MGDDPQDLSARRWLQFAQGAFRARAAHDGLLATPPRSLDSPPPAGEPLPQQEQLPLPPVLAIEDPVLKQREALAKAVGDLPSLEPPAATSANSEGSLSGDPSTEPQPETHLTMQQLNQFLRTVHELPMPQAPTEEVDALSSRESTSTFNPGVEHLPPTLLQCSLMHAFTAKLQGQRATPGRREQYVPSDLVLDPSSSMSYVMGPEVYFDTSVVGRPWSTGPNLDDVQTPKKAPTLTHTIQWPFVLQPGADKEDQQQKLLNAKALDPKKPVKVPLTLLRDWDSTLRLTEVHLGRMEYVASALKRVSESDSLDASLRLRLVGDLADDVGTSLKKVNYANLRALANLALLRRDVALAESDATEDARAFLRAAPLFARKLMDEHPSIHRGHLLQRERNAPHILLTCAADRGRQTSRGALISSSLGLKRQAPQTQQRAKRSRSEPSPPHGARGRKRFSSRPYRPPRGRSSAPARDTHRTPSLPPRGRGKPASSSRRR